MRQCSKAATLEVEDIDLHASVRWWQTLFPDIQVDAVWPVKPTQSKLPHGKNTLGWAEHHHHSPGTVPCNTTDKTASVKQDPGSACHSRTGPRRAVRGGPEWLFSRFDATHAEPQSVGSQKFCNLIGCCVLKAWQKNQQKKTQKTNPNMPFIHWYQSREGCYHVAAIENMVPGMSTCVSSAKSCVLWASVNCELCRRTEEKTAAKASRWCWE